MDGKRKGGVLRDCCQAVAGGTPQQEVPSKMKSCRLHFIFAKVLLLLLIIVSFIFQKKKKKEKFVPHDGKCSLAMS